jgi:hypothetical protein
MSASIHPWNSLGPVSFEIARDFFLSAIIRAWYKVDKLKFGERKTGYFEAILTLADCLYIELSKNTTPTTIGLVVVEKWLTKWAHV